VAIPDSQRVNVEYDVVFGSGGGRDLRCNVYTPPAASHNGAAVLLVHGGGWREGDRSQLHGYGILLGRKGYTCVASEYRLTPEAKWPAQIEDVKAALRWMRANAGRLNIDPARIAVEGNSAGAHLALVVAGTPNLAAFEGSGGNTGTDTGVAACIAIYPPTDLRASGPFPAIVDSLFGAGATQATAAAASPITMATPGHPPAQLIHGSADELVPIAESVRMYQALLDAGVPAELHTYAEQLHAFDAAPAFGRQCAEIMALFLDRYIGHPEQYQAEAHSPTEAVAAVAS
jgi:acetyl esterase/lipase